MNYKCPKCGDTRSPELKSEVLYNFTIFYLECIRRKCSYSVSLDEFQGVVKVEELVKKYNAKN